MAEKIFILGNSGTGKSTSLRNLNPEDTFILQGVNKKLPFKGWKNKYTKISKENPKGNLSLSKNYDNLRKQLVYIHNKRKDIKIVIIDDSHYLMTGDFMNRITEKVSKGGGFEKYDPIAYNFYSILKLVWSIREDIIVLTNDDGTKPCKAPLKMFEDLYIDNNLKDVIDKIREYEN